MKISIYWSIVAGVVVAFFLTYFFTKGTLDYLRTQNEVYHAQISKTLGYCEENEPESKACINLKYMFYHNSTQPLQ